MWSRRDIVDDVRTAVAENKDILAPIQELLRNKSYTNLHRSA